MRTMKQCAAAVIAVALAMALCAPMANACGVPFVDDIPELSGTSYAAVFCAKGPEKSAQWRITDAKTGKRVRPDVTRKYKQYHVAGMWLKTNHVYKISVRAKKAGKYTKWKTIYYGIER